MTQEVGGGPWLLPEEPIAVRLMNTIWAQRGVVRDALQTGVDLRHWLAVTGLLERSHPTAADVQEARALRDALRRLAAHVTDDDRGRVGSDMELRQALDAVNAVMSSAPERDRLTLRGRRLERLTEVEAAPVPGALATVARSGAALLADPELVLRPCYAPGCVLYFVKDHPRREWCSVSCGNRARAARHYQRQRQERHS